MALCPLIAFAAFIFVGLPQLQPKPLEVAQPDVYTAIKEAIPTVEDSIADAQTVIDDVQGANADPVDETLSAAGKVYGSTWLTADDSSVQAVTKKITECEAKMNDAQNLLDPAKTLVGMSGQGDDAVTPRIVESSDTIGVPQSLQGCIDDLKKLSTDAQDALTQAKITASDTQATTDNKTARDTLTATINAAQATLDGSAGKVSDDAVRQALQASLDAAKTASEGAAVSTGWEEIDKDTGVINQANTDLTAANQAVVDAQTSWQAEQDRIAAEAAAAAAAQSNRSSGSGGTGRSEYTSPTSGGESDGGNGDHTPPPAPYVPTVVKSISCTDTMCFGVCSASGGNINYSLVKVWPGGGQWTEATAKADFDTRCPG